MAGAAASAGRGGMFFVRPRLANGQRVRSYLLPMKSPNGSSGAFRRSHGDKTEPAGPAIGAINGEIDLGHVAMGGKQFLEFAVSSGGSQIVHV